jgi:hypothetical protein
MVSDTRSSSSYREEKSSYRSSSAGPQRAYVVDEGYGNTLERMKKRQNSGMSPGGGNNVNGGGPDWNRHLGETNHHLKG